MVTFHFVCLFVTDIKSRKYPTQAFISKVKTRYLVIFITCLSKTVKWLEISTLHDILMLAWKIWPSGGGLKNELRWWDFSFEVVGFFVWGGGIFHLWWEESPHQLMEFRKKMIYTMLFWAPRTPLNSPIFTYVNTIRCPTPKNQISALGKAGEKLIFIEWEMIPTNCNSENT